MSNQNAEFRTQELTINMGPQHPSTHGVLRLEIISDGEIIKAAYPDLGYLHRCFEKHAEGREYLQVVPYTDRLDYVAAMNQELGFCLAVEKLIDAQIPERAQAIRVIVSELQRIASHLLAVGTYGIDIGAFTAALFAFRDREHILTIFEELSGARLLYNYIRPGGVAKDLSRGLEEKVKEFCRYFVPQLQEFEGLVSGNAIFLDRTCDVGVISAEMALAYGFSGVNLRGSGVDWDLRKVNPYSGYEKYDFKSVPATLEHGVAGDCWNRYNCRIKEMYESIKIIEQALAQIQPGDSMAKVPKAIKTTGEVYMETECPRGNLGYYIVGDGSKVPYRVKVKSPGFISIACFDEIASGMMLADIVALIGSLDFVMGEVDR